jgi:hypothetical protein
LGAAEDAVQVVVGAAQCARVGQSVERLPHAEQKLGGREGAHQEILGADRDPLAGRFRRREIGDDDHRHPAARALPLQYLDEAHALPPDHAEID